MKRCFMVLMVTLSMVILLSPCSSLAASSTASTTKKAATSSTKAIQPQPGGIVKLMMKNKTDSFGYPPRVVGSSKEYAVPFFDRLINVGEDGKYNPMLALRWDTSKDGTAITFKLRQGVTFHDGTPFNAQAVKSNIDDIIPPKATNLLPGVTSVDVIDDYTIKFNLSEYNNIFFFHLAFNPATYMYSPEALKKNGADWAMTHPVGTGPFMLKDYQPNTSVTYVKNPNYWQKGLPYLDGIEITMVPDPMTQMITLKAGQANAIYGAQEAATQLRDDGYPLWIAPGSQYSMCFDTKNSEIFSKRQVREAIEYAIDKEAIWKGPGEGIYKAAYQMVTDTSPDYNKSCPPRKYDPAKAKKLLAEAGYPNGFSFKIFMQDTIWKNGIVAVQSYLEKVGIKMEINYLNTSQYNLIKQSGAIEKGASAALAYTNSSNTLFILDSYWRSDSKIYPYVVRPAGIDKLIDQAKLSRDPAVITKLNKQILKLIYDDETVVPLWEAPRIAVADKSVQNTGWFIYGDPDNNQFGTRTWLKK